MTMAYLIPLAAWSPALLLLPGAVLLIIAVGVGAAWWIARKKDRPHP
jgi:hypothetical protein